VGGKGEDRGREEGGEGGGKRERRGGGDKGGGKRGGGKRWLRERNAAHKQNTLSVCNRTICSI
jgi:hypothetical protein